MAGRVFENEYYRIEIKNNIMFAFYKQEITITLPFAKKMVEDRLTFQHQENYTSIPIVHYFKAKYVDKAARKYFSEEGIVGLSAAAFIVKTLATKTLVNIFLLIEKPKLPIRAFEDEAAATAWIKDIVKE